MTGSGGAVLVEVREGVALVTINRPEENNTLNDDLRRGLEGAWRDLREDRAVRAIVLTGAGDRCFLTGVDRSMEGDEYRRFQRDLPEPPSGPLLRAEAWLQTGPNWKPIIAAVNGHCIATGMGMLTAADYRIAADHASFSAIEVRLGHLCHTGAIARLVRQIAYCHAMELLLTGRRISAAEALRIHLVNEVVAGPALLPRAMAVARSMAEREPASVQIAKQAAVRGLDVGLRHALAEEGLYAAMLSRRRTMAAQGA